MRFPQSLLVHHQDVVLRSVFVPDLRAVLVVALVNSIAGGDLVNFVVLNSNCGSIYQIKSFLLETFLNTFQLTNCYFLAVVVVVPVPIIFELHNGVPRGYLGHCGCRRLIQQFVHFTVHWSARKQSFKVFWQIKFLFSTSENPQRDFWNPLQLNFVLEMQQLEKVESLRCNVSGFILNCQDFSFSKDKLMPSRKMWPLKDCNFPYAGRFRASDSKMKFPQKYKALS